MKSDSFLGSILFLTAMLLFFFPLHLDHCSIKHVFGEIAFRRCKLMAAEDHLGGRRDAAIR